MPAVVIEIPPSLKLLITRALILLPPEPAARSRLSAPVPAIVPSKSMSGTLEYPGWLVPSIKTGTVMVGSASRRCVWAPVPMPKSIVLGPGVAESELRIACRSDPAPSRPWS